jgi:SAM-dependent methyltransferase
VGHFRRIAQRGFGSGHNSYAYSSAWFNDHLYIGTNRNALQTIITRWPFEAPFEFPPVPVPDRYEKLDLRGQIWRYSPSSAHWERVFRSPMVRGYEGRLAPLAVAFRCMTIFQGKSDQQPALYTIPVVGRNAPGSSTLRSVDGVHFEALPPPRVEGQQERFGSFRAIAAFKGKLWAAPAHTKGDPKILRTYANVSEEVDVRCTDDPVRGSWRISCPPAFGDPTNRGIIDMLAWDDHLYVGTLNVRQGFQLWRTNGEGRAPHRWEKVLDCGADRGPLNQAVLSMAVFNDCLYLGTAIQNGGHDQTNNIGPAAAEVIRVYPDGTWDLVCGFPRMTRQGLKIPTSGMGPGFDNPLAGYIWRMCAHDGALYVGTYDMSSYVPFVDRSRWPSHIQRIFDPATLERFMRLRGGAELWRSTDGDRWVPVTRNGFDNPYNFGIRALVSTPVGLFVGTANPFGPKVAVKTASGWRYEDNPRGGIEIWHGAPEHAVHRAPRSGADRPTGPWPRMASESIVTTPPFAEPTFDAESPESKAAMFLAPEEPGYAVDELEQALRGASASDPVLSLATTDKDLAGLNESLADAISDYFEGGVVRNAGYWRDETDTPQNAALALVHELLARCPGDDAQPSSFLILAEGASAIGSLIRENNDQATITVASQEALTRSVHWTDRLKIGRISKNRLNVPDSSCDVVLWIEGPSAAGRSRALDEVHRILRPGGWLLAADLIGRSLKSLEPRGLDRPPDHTAEYHRDLLESGFAEATITDIARMGWHRFHHHSRQFFLTRLLFQQIDSPRHAEILAALPGGDLLVEAHLLISARKPEGPSP